MMLQLLWNCFEQTGWISAYLCYRAYLDANEEALDDDSTDQEEPAQISQ